MLPAARRRGHATRIARLLAEHAFSLGVVRVAAYVNVGNRASERVLERAGFAREGVVRSMPVPSGARIDKTLFSCLDSTSDDEKAFARQRHQTMEADMSSVDEQSARRDRQPAGEARGDEARGRGRCRSPTSIGPRRFYESLGWRLDADLAVDDGYRVVQLTPPGSGCSIIFGTGVTSAAPGSAEGLQLSVYDIDEARADLIARGRRRQRAVPRRDRHLPPRRDRGARGRRGARSTPTTARSPSFSDPDGNGWLLQEIKTRLPGR